MDKKPDRVMQFFAYAHLPPHIQEICKPFDDLAQQIVDTRPANSRRTMGLLKLLEVRDHFIRAKPYKKPD